MITRKTTITIVAAILRQGDTFLLVQQQGRDDAAPSWSLPGGVVEDGELLHEALVREVYEETGLRVVEIGPLAYVTQVNDRQSGVQSLAFVFEVARWEGNLNATADPDELIHQVVFLPLAEAIERLASLPWQAMREPAIAYLQGTCQRGMVWMYRMR